MKRFMGMIIGDSDFMTIEELMKTVPLAKQAHKQSENGYHQRKREAMDKLEKEIAKEIKHSTEHGWYSASFDVDEDYINKIEFEFLKGELQKRGYKTEEAYSCGHRQLRIKW